MKKLLLLNVGIVSLISLVYSQRSPTPVKNDWQKQGLKGKVKSCIYWEYERGVASGLLIDSFTSKYDYKGNLHNWWTKDDRRKFNAKVKDVIKQYETFALYDGIIMDNSPGIYPSDGDLFLIVP